METSGYCSRNACSWGASQEPPKPTVVVTRRRPAGFSLLSVSSASVMASLANTSRTVRLRLSPCSVRIRPRAWRWNSGTGERLLECRDLARDGGLAEVQRVAGMGEAAGLGDGVEDAQLVPVHGAGPHHVRASVPRLVWPKARASPWTHRGTLSPGPLPGGSASWTSAGGSAPRPAFVEVSQGDSHECRSRGRCPLAGPGQSPGLPSCGPLTTPPARARWPRRCPRRLRATAPPPAPPCSRSRRRSRPGGRPGPARRPPRYTPATEVAVLPGRVST